MPQIFHRIQFWRIRRQGYNRDVLRNLQFLAHVEPGSIPNHHYMHILRNFFGKEFQENIHHFHIDVWREHPDGVAGSRASRADNIQPIVLRLTNSGEPFTSSGPAFRQRALLTKSRLVLKVCLYSFVGMIEGDLSQYFREVFLKASWACASDFSCLGRGER